MNLSGFRPKNETFTCPLRESDGTADDNSPIVWAGRNKDTWVRRSKDGPEQCTYCGSVHPAHFIAQLTEGRALGVTDKDYKAYLEGPVTRKFYYQHLNPEERRQFIALLNARRIIFSYPGHFTRLPYFIKLATDQGDSQQ